MSSTTGGNNANATSTPPRQREDVLSHPFVAVVTHASGIHPSTSRLISLDAVTFDVTGAIGEEFHAIFNPGGDPGPYHQHGLTHEEVREAKRFSHSLKTLDRLIDGRTLIVHNAPQAWGFIVSEARRAMNAAARANRSRSRGRGRGRRRQRVGHIPRPEMIVDTLATARRQGIPLADTRIFAVASTFGLDAPDPVASVERAHQPAEDVARQRTLLVRDLYLTQRDKDVVAQRSPRELRADRFGLQRSHVRVDAMEQERSVENPGKLDPAKGVQPGMEFVIAPQITADPNNLIAAGVEAGLAYSEKLTRDTSLVVSNQREDVDGKAMHALRKDIPLLSDEDFLAQVSRTGGVIT